MGFKIGNIYTLPTEADYSIMSGFETLQDIEDNFGDTELELFKELGYIKNDHLVFPAGTKFLKIVDTYLDGNNGDMAFQLIDFGIFVRFIADQNTGELFGIEWEDDENE